MTTSVMQNFLFFSTITLVAPTALCGEQINSTPGSKSSIKQTSTKEQTMSNSMLVATSKESTPLSSEQRIYLNSVFSAILRVVSGESTLEKEEKIFGDGIDHWPKNPGPPTIRYYTNSPYQGFSISFEKKKGGEVWAESTLTILPSGYPSTVFRMDLPKQFFSGLILENIRTELQENKPIKNVVIFSFKTNQLNNNLRLEFKVRENMVDVKKHSFPDSFHVLTVARIQ